ncbi:MAG: ATP-binding protein [Dehalococcoidia bacterium]
MNGIRSAITDPRAGVAAALAGTAVVTGVLAPFQNEAGLLNEGLALLLLTLLISATWGSRVGLFAALITNLSLNFFFVEPLHTFNVHAPDQIGALFVFLGVSIIGGSLLSRAQSAARAAQRRQAETAVLLDLSRDLIGRANPNDALSALCENVVRAFAARGAAVLSPASDGWRVLAHAGGEHAQQPLTRAEAAVAARAVETGSTTSTGRIALTSSRRRGTCRRADSGDASEGVAFAPFRIDDRPLGVLRLDGPIGDTPFSDHPEELLQAFAREAALGVQRVELAQEAAHAEALRQADELKNALMASISHDLKTPLASIKAAVSSLLDTSVAWSDDDVQVFLQTIDTQSDRLDRVISDILDLNRIESGAVRPVRASVRVRDLLEEAVESTRGVTAGRDLTIDAPEGLVVDTDASLVRQALVNLIENAAKYSSPGGAIRLRAAATESGVELAVQDEGPGIAERDVPFLFDRFYRGEQSARIKGSGLGLAIVKGFITLAGGAVRVERSNGGTSFVIALATSAGVGAA